MTSFYCIVCKKQDWGADDNVGKLPIGTEYMHTGHKTLSADEKDITNYIICIDCCHKVSNYLKSERYNRIC